MRQSRTIMGMPVQLEILGKSVPQSLYDEVFDYFTAIDERFSPYKDTSEVSVINRGEVDASEYSDQMKEVITLSEDTAIRTKGYFNTTTPEGTFDPSGLVKGWAINNAAALLRKKGITDFYVEIAGDIQTAGNESSGKEWSIGIRNPFAYDEIVKVVFPRGKGIATSGTAVRGNHIYNPHVPHDESNELVSLTVIGPNVYEADRFATAAFAMGRSGVYFLESLPGFEAYAIDKDGIATMTSNFETYTV